MNREQRNELIGRVFNWLYGDRTSKLPTTDEMTNLLSLPPERGLIESHAATSQDSHGVAGAVTGNNTVRDLRRFACALEDSDDRELVQHAADMLEVLLKSPSKVHIPYPTTSASSGDATKAATVAGPWNE